MSNPGTSWDRALLAVRLMAVDPKGLGGIVVKSRIGPARDAYLRALTHVATAPTRLHPMLEPDAIDGGLDVAATLAAGQMVASTGQLDRTDSPFLLTMAERTTPYLATRLAEALDKRQLNGLIALDEGIDDECLPPALADRLAFCVNLNDIPLADLASFIDAASQINIASIDVPDDIPEQLVSLAVTLGIDSLRAPTFALRTAKAHAAASGRNRVCFDDVEVAVQLVFAHRAMRLPHDVEPPEQQSNEERSDPVSRPEDITAQVPDDILLDAVLSALPKGLLDTLRSQKSSSAKGIGSGQKTNGNRKGRPLPPRQRSRRASERIDLIATLRAAVPWQTIRKKTAKAKIGPIIRPQDLRAKRYQTLSDRVLIFTVDASGSAAAARLNEAKGAVELLLTEAYSRRDHVALISFRGTSAEVLLPPTRSLTQTKRRLAALPGGGGTPLASGLTAALALSHAARKKGQTPAIIVLTDGRANISMDGQADRVAAAQDAENAALQVGKSGIEALMIDTGLRPERSLNALADLMRARYLPLPRSDAKRLSDTITSSLT